MKTRIWIDADSCPRMVRNHVVKCAKKARLSVFFVANRPIPAEPSGCQMIVCPEMPDAADNYIAAHAAPCDLVITRDIPLAARLVESDIAVINDRGTAFTADIIRKKMEDREFDLQLSSIGLGGRKRSTYSGREFSQFANCFDRTLRLLGALQQEDDS